MKKIDICLGAHEPEGYSLTQTYITQIVNMNDEAALKRINDYCKEHNIIPNLIDEDKLKKVLDLGINELKRRELGIYNEMERRIDDALEYIDKELIKIEKHQYATGSRRLLRLRDILRWKVR